MSSAGSAVLRGSARVVIAVFPWAQDPDPAPQVYAERNVEVAMEIIGSRLRDQDAGVLQESEKALSSKDNTMTNEPSAEKCDLALRLAADLRELSQASHALAGRPDAVPGGGLLFAEGSGLLVRVLAEGLAEELLSKSTLPDAVVDLVANTSVQAAMPEGEPEDSHPTSGIPTISHEVRIEAGLSEHDLVWQQRVNQLRMEEMLLSIVRDGDNAGMQLEMQQAEMLQWIWTVLSSRDGVDLPSEVALLKHDALPGIDPWLGNARDFRKVAWVLSEVAQDLEERFDVITLSKAAETAGCHAGVLSRACSPTKTRPPRIKVAGKRGRELLLQRSSFLVWFDEYRRDKLTRAQRDRAAIEPQHQYECKECGWKSQAVKAKPKKCQKCTSTVLSRLLPHPRRRRQSR